MGHLNEIVFLMKGDFSRGFYSILLLFDSLFFPQGLNIFYFYEMLIIYAFNFDDACEPK